ncbi:DUF916 domain-containing protein [Patescibacteria group bacterium]|nr:DUF916 domain-containing protein [Patescibacteria group bacterium]
MTKFLSIKKFKHSFKISNLKPARPAGGLKIAVFFVLGLALFVSKLNPVEAQSSRTFTISPPTLTFNLEPGKREEKIIKIINNSAEPITFFIGIQDFIVNDKAGTPELLPIEFANNKYAASTWATAFPETVTVQPGKTETTTLHLQVPGDTRPGGRYISLTLRPANSDSPDGSGAAVDAVIGTLVYITIPGDIEENAQVVSFSAPFLSEYGPIPLTTEIKNLGDLHINPKATVEVKNLFGKKVHSFALDNINIFPGTSRIYENSWETKWLFGRYAANLSGYFGTNNQNLAAITYFWVIPYKLIAIALLAAALVLVTVFYLKKRNEPQEIVEETE